MKHVSILVPQGDCSMTNIEGTWQILHRVNDFSVETIGEPLFDIHLVGIKEEIKMRRGLFSVRPDLMLEDVAHTDLVLIPSVHGDMPSILSANRPMLDWIVQQYKGGAAVAS
ncbi:MAG: AraC family transcriptional regulator, partial [Bacteroidetes bacterium]|nr:AraC family transcriptional regulator [Bacteroidota bacterium]